MVIGIGSVVWYYDMNHREYTKPAKGRIWGDLIPRAHWRPRKITGETSRSWVVEGGKKLPKDVSKWNSRLWALSERAVDDWAWAHEHRFKIAKLVERLEHNAPLLRQVAALVDYKE